MNILFRGTAPALVTPFTADGAIDEGAFRRLIDRQIGGGVEALVVLGTTGENATIWPDERRRLIAVASRIVARADDHRHAPVGVFEGDRDEAAAFVGPDRSVLAQGCRVATRPARPLHARRSAS